LADNSFPKLVVLARVNPEEAVLAACRHKKANPVNPSVADITCLRADTCAPCNSSMSS
jgi:hypothetical protein